MYSIRFRSYGPDTFLARTLARTDRGKKFGLDTILKAEYDRGFFLVRDILARYDLAISEIYTWMQVWTDWWTDWG